MMNSRFILGFRWRGRFKNCEDGHTFQGFLEQGFKIDWVSTGCTNMSRVMDDAYRLKLGDVGMFAYGQLVSPWMGEYEQQQGCCF